MDNPRYVIADRRDLLGGRLIPLLNAMRLARHWGAKFLMTWYTNSTDFQAHIAGVSEIFSGEIVEDFSVETGHGTIIGPDDALTEACNAVEIIGSEGGEDWGSATCW